MSPYRVPGITTTATPALVYHCEMDFACRMAIRNPRLAIVSALLALSAAIKLRRPDLAYTANCLLGALS